MKMVKLLVPTIKLKIERKIRKMRIIDGERREKKLESK